MKRLLHIGISGLILVSLLWPAGFNHAATVDELQSQIDSYNNNIKQLQDEIARYEAELSKTSAQATTLQTAVKSLDTNSKKLGADLNVTQNKIQTTNLTLTSLQKQILDKQSKIQVSQKALGESMRELNETDSQSLLETMINYPNLSRFWDEVETTNRFQSKVQDTIDDLKGLQKGLETNKSQTQTQKQQLESLKSTLADQQTVVEAAKKEKNKLLTQTKSQESAYKALIAEKKAKEEQFNQDLLQAEQNLKLTIDPNSVPKAKTGILSWPLDKHIVTQTFGVTDFSLAHPGLYTGQGHNGIDIGASIGTPIKAAADGVVLGSGDTDTACPNASYGKWVFIKHNNGLSTLYAHLSVIKATKGQSVARGDVIGYSGMTGYATGPHLHFTVYASQGVEIASRSSKACNGRVYTMPLADLEAYLNPMSYL
jgi:murein DD-endopeptidase MepM/ murein hydrolase activator NlpD